MLERCCGRLVTTLVTVMVFFRIWNMGCQPTLGRYPLPTNPSPLFPFHSSSHPFHSHPIHIPGTRWPSGTRLDFAIARLRVRLPPVAAVYQRLLSVPSLRGRLMSSSLRSTGWRPSAADWGGGMSVVLRRGSTCPLSRAVYGCIPRHGIISSCQSAATSRIVKRCCSC